MPRVPARELVVLGTASQVPTRTRNHTGHLLRWDGAGLLLDPGEGTQRQLTLAGVPASAVSAIAITHAHGDHTLGLPGVLQRMALDGVRGPVPLVFPEAATGAVAHLLGAAAHAAELVEPHPVTGDGPVLALAGAVLEAAALDHRVPAVGYRLVEPDGRRMLSGALAARGIAGPDVGRLQREGSLPTADGGVRLEEVSAPRPGQRFAFVMDTRVCDGAARLAEGADLLVCEATFSSADADLAQSYAHLTARQAGQIAAAAGARRLVIAHFSGRYPDAEVLGAEALEVDGDVVVAEDLLRVPVPARRVI